MVKKKNAIQNPNHIEYAIYYLLEQFPSKSENWLNYFC